jgi:iron complex transport system substrate-binding protein
LRKLLCLTGIGLLILCGFTALAEAGEITDIFGRRLYVPDRARKAFSTGPSGTYLLYAIDPVILAGLNFPVRVKDRKYMHECVTRLPVIGWFGQGQTPNKETLLALKPDVIFSSKVDHELSSKVDETLKVMNMPVVEMTVDNLSDYPEAFQYAGRILGREARAGKLSDYSREALAEAEEVVSGLPRDKRVSVYYAEGRDGLSTECDTARHVELIRLAGGMNVHRCVARNPYGLEKVSLEQVLLYDPEVILVMDRVFYKNVFSDPIWRKIRAVRQKRVYLIPEHPINWFDRPPSFMRFIGLKWLMNRLYPDGYRIDIVEEARYFYRLFLGIDLSDAEMREIIYR